VPFTGDFKFVHVEMLGPHPAALGLFAPGAGDEDATHRLGGCAMYWTS